MSPRIFPRAVFAVALSLSSVPVAHADDPPTTAPQPAAPTPGAVNPEDRPREGGPREGGRRGGEGGPREGGPREGRRGGGGGPREGGGGPDALRPGETPEQRNERLVQPYVEMVPDLSEDQKTHILAILEAASAELRASRANLALSEDRRRAATRFVRSSIADRVTAALTEEQLATYNALRAEQATAMADMEKIGSVRPDEDVEEKRARLLKGYEEAMEELSVKQKTDIIKILELSAEDTDAIRADTKLTEAARTQALRQQHDSVTAKILPLLDAEQKVIWKKALTAQRP